jgi:hypothetical protein
VIVTTRSRLGGGEPGPETVGGSESPAGETGSNGPVGDSGRGRRTRARVAATV